VTGEGSLSADADPSSVADCVRATFSHKGRREVGATAGVIRARVLPPIRQLAIRHQTRFCYGHDG
jgi:hypothetical protein